MALSQQKPPNGQANGGTYLLTFDLDDEAQAKAWEMAQQLASGRKLKHILVSMLLAIHTVQEHTGKQIDMTEFLACFITNMVVGGKAYSVPLMKETTTPEELPSLFSGTVNHADPMEARQAFVGGMGNLFEDSEDTLWDD